MNYNSFLTFKKDIFIFLVIIFVFKCDLIACKIRIVTPKWDYKCEDGEGAFPHASDCQRQDDRTNFQ